MEVLEYAKQELSRIPKDDTQTVINGNILEIIELLESQGPSGFSAQYLLSVLNRLCNQKPLTPLTGKQEEWTEYGQNKRCSSVFKNKNGDVTDIDAIIVSDNGGFTWFQSPRFRKKVTFPYLPPTTPEKVYIENIEEMGPGFTSDKYDIITDKPDRIAALYNKVLMEYNNLDLE